MSTAEPHCSVEAEVRRWAKLDSAPSPGQYVYALWCENAAPARAIGDSRVLYIGQGKAARLQLLQKKEHHAQRWLVSHNLVATQRQAEPLVVTVRYHTCAATNLKADLSDSQLAEIGLLNNFFRDHGELPLLNSKHEGWAAGKVLQALARSLSEAEPATILDGPNSGWSMVWGKAKKSDDFVLAWLWPDNWHSGAVEAPNNRGDLLLIRPGERGEALPQALNPGHAKWNPMSKVTARCPASALAGESADQKNEKLRDLWKALSKGAGAGSLDGLEGEMARVPKGWRAT